MLMAAHLATVIYVAIGSLDWKAYQRIIQKNTKALKQREEMVILLILRKDLEKMT